MAIFHKAESLLGTGMKCVDLTEECIKVLGVHMSYNKELQGDKK